MSLRIRGIRIDGFGPLNELAFAPGSTPGSFSSFAYDAAMLMFLDPRSGDNFVVSAKRANWNAEDRTWELTGGRRDLGIQVCGFLSQVP